MKRTLVLGWAAALACCSAFGADADWSVYGGEAHGTRYSTLTQIDRNNVAKLRTAWTLPFEELGASQTHPLAIDGIIYAYTPSLKVIAIDGATGQQRWQFDSGIPGSGPQRGLAYWRDGMQRRLLASVMNYLYALDPATGEPIKSFGDNGRIDLRSGLGPNAERSFLSLTSPGVVYKDTIIVGFRTGETIPAVPGDIRAFDVRTGKLRWTFHTIPHPGEFGYETWPKDAWQRSGGANVWSGLVLDEKRGIVYGATGSAVNDFYGGDRLGDNLFANTLLALDARTGKRLWHFQGVHHDVLDRDFSAPPVLLTVRHKGKNVPALAQPTKQGFLFVLGRVTGQPLFPIEEHAYPQTDVPGEVTSATQPRALVPEPYARQFLTAEMLTQRTPEMHAWASEQFKKFVSSGPFTPLTLGKQTIVFPGYDGGAEWGGIAADPRRGVVFINANDIAWTGGLIDSSAMHGAGAITYRDQCSVCHGADRSGSPPAFPSLLDIDKRLTAQQIADVIHQGRGRMPAFPSIRQGELNALLTFLQTGKTEDREPVAQTDGSGPRYVFTGYKKFLDPEGYPAVAPPWGTLNAIDLNTGKYLWKIPLGYYPELAAKGQANTGTENYGGPLVTASGLLIIGATLHDKKIRAFHTETGALLWEHTLPFAGLATPITYMAGGKQYIVIATTNARGYAPKPGAAYVGISLPEPP
jgi:quinoprotein glucose dehydrogenase